MKGNVNQSLKYSKLGGTSKYNKRSSKSQLLQDRIPILRL